jgi:hypothetical protein
VLEYFRRIAEVDVGVAAEYGSDALACSGKWNVSPARAGLALEHEPQEIRARFERAADLQQLVGGLLRGGYEIGQRPVWRVAFHHDHRRLDQEIGDRRELVKRGHEIARRHFSESWRGARKLIAA